ncbi:MAG: transposase [Myxococcales bacterium]|nr:transposase [Myxococcales bacterium]
MAATAAGWRGCAKYITRPPVAQERLERRPDGKLELSFKRAWRDGTRALVFEPADLIPRLVASVPPPRWHLLRYFGVLSSHSSRRRLVVPAPPPDPVANRPRPLAAISSSCSATRTMHPRLARDGPGCSRTSSPPTSRPARAAPAQCAGPRLPGRARRSPACSRSMASEPRAPPESGYGSARPSRWCWGSGRSEARAERPRRTRRCVLRTRTCPLNSRYPQILPRSTLRAARGVHGPALDPAPACAYSSTRWVLAVHSPYAQATWRG